MDTMFERQTDFLQRLNDTMAHGWVADYALVLPGDEDNFSRVTATPNRLRSSYDKVLAELRVSGIAVPRAYDVYARPIIRLAVASGYAGDHLNPNDHVCMGLAVPAYLRGLALGVPVADAPAAAVVHTPTGITAAVSGIWQRLAAGTVEETVAIIKEQVEMLGEKFDVSDLWVITSSGARADSFFIDDRGVQKLIPLREKIVLENYLQQLKTPVCESGRVKPYGLDLAGLFYELWQRAGIPAEQIHFDARNNMTHEVGGELVLPSKRRAEREGKPGYSSGLLAVVVRRVTS